MTTIIQTGTKYDLYDSSIQTHQSLPAGIYRITFSPQSGHKLLYIADKNDIKEKIYGVHTKKIEKVLNTNDLEKLGLNLDDYKVQKDILENLTIA